jgi:SAM-dependent methyltransferase
MTRSPDSPTRDFTPAVPLLGLYDFIVATLTRETLWRGALLRQVQPRKDDVIADLGCGTASFLSLLGRAVAPARLIGIDPDVAILAMAQRKLSSAGVPALLLHGYLHDAARLLANSGPNKIVSSLVFHQVPLAEKRAGLAAIHAALVPGGELHIADYGWQRTRAMRSLFRVVQCVDGFADTQPNADGILPDLMKEAGFVEVEETGVIPTATGSISLYRAKRPAGSRAPQPVEVSPVRG